MFTITLLEVALQILQYLMSVVLQQQLFIIVQLKIGTLYPRMSNNSARSMDSTVLQNNTL